MKILVLHGPNLNLLGEREPHIYGTTTLSEINENLKKKAKELHVDVDLRQSNHEGHLIDWVQEWVSLSKLEKTGILINPAGYTHTSIALADVIAAYTHPCIEIHLSDPEKREDFRKISYIRPYVADVVKGLGAHGYMVALEKLVHLAQH